jgi:hypothetical protein
MQLGFVYQNNENMIHYSSTINGNSFLFFLSLSFTHFAMIHKKHTCLLSVQMGTATLKHGKTDTFESIY